MPNLNPLLRFMVKHPALTATAGAGAILSGDIGDRAERLEAEIMRNRLGAPGGKFVYSELNKFAERKKYLEKKTSFVKKADDATIADAVARAAAGGAAGATASKLMEGLSAGASRAARKVKDKLVLEPKRERILEELTAEDPVISVYEKESPGSAQQAYSSMRRFAPELSTDPNVVAAYLREAAQTGGAANHMMIKQLAETEAAINKAQGRG